MDRLWGEAGVEGFDHRFRPLGRHPGQALALALAIALIPGAAVSAQAPAKPDVVTAEAALPGPVPPGAERDAILRAASAQLSALKLAEGEFLQIGNDGQVVSGKFALRRPGRMRFAYDAPSPLLLVADGTNVAVQDRKLKTTDRIPLRQTPLFFILKDNVDITRDANVLRMVRGKGEMRVTLTDRARETEGELTLSFSDGDYRLLEWSVTDPQGAVTQVVLRNVTYPKSLDARLFVVRDLTEGPRR